MEEFVKNIDSLMDSWWPFVIASIITIISFIKIYFGGKYCETTDGVYDRTILITGATSGIGFETAKELARREGKLILAVRNYEKGLRTVEEIRQYIPEAQLTLKIVDMSDFSSIRKFAQDLLDNYKVIDILINNAAVINHPYKLTKDGHEIHMATNYYGPFLLTHLLLPLLKKSDDARVINVSAMAHYNAKLNLDDLNLEKSFTPGAAFAQSKLCLTMFTKHISYYYKRTALTFNAADPGLVRDTNHMNQLLFNKSFIARWSISPWIWLFLKSPKQGSQTIIYLAVETTQCHVSGFYNSECQIKEPAPAVKDEKLCTALYEKTCKIVGVPFVPLEHGYEDPDMF